MTMSGERQFTRSNRNESQEASEAWFERLSRHTKKSIENILIAKPEITKEQIMNLIKDKKRMIGENYLSDSGATFLVAADLGISASRQLGFEG